MSTRSAIGMKRPDGTIRAVYCHYDGYPSYNGKILNEHYRNSEKLVRLLDEGDLSSLDREIGTRHDFDKPAKGVCTFYGRDRGEVGIDSLVFDDEAEFLSYYGSCEFFYVYEQAAWKVTSCGETAWQPLTKILTEEIENV